MEEWLSSMSQTELLTRLSILGVVLFLIMLGCCYSICKSWVMRNRSAERNAPNAPAIALFQPPTYQQALKKMRRRRNRQQDDAPTGGHNNGRSDTGTLLEVAEPTGDSDSEEDDIVKAGTGEVVNGNADENCATRNTGDDSDVKRDFKEDKVNSSMDEGTSTKDSVVKSSIVVDTDKCKSKINRCDQCKSKSSCGGSCNGDGDSGGKYDTAIEAVGVEESMAPLPQTNL